MKRFLPQSLPSWILLILITGLITTQIATLSIVSRDRNEGNNIQELFRLSDRAYTLVKLLYASPPPERTRLATAMSNVSSPLYMSDEPAVKSAIAADDNLAELEDVLVARFSAFGVTDARVRRDSPKVVTGMPVNPSTFNPDVGIVERQLTDLAQDFSESGGLAASIEFSDGQWLNFVTPVAPIDPILTTQTLPLFGSVAAIVIIMSIWAMRRLTAPYRALESAVKRIGEDVKIPPLPEYGSTEYKSAARAVNAMQAQLREYVADREQLAAALAHDLRTPLTRIRLRLELLRKSQLRQSLMQDLNDIEAISRSVIDFATYEIVEEEQEKIDFWSLVDSIADNYPEVTFGKSSSASRKLICFGRPIALRRCITNLIDNAVKYGQSANVDLSQVENDIVLVIRDKGPGIPQEKLDEVFQPFRRVEGSRNRETGGFGLGLTIARNIAQRCGGDIVLKNDPEGGLRAELRIPLA
ncbi:HAMP domain-containing protein [Phyllobacterium sp. 628]|uniref:ATP-binding protein n=1 Tax=Phyllobacterium sp. 628 TaxID=2718938 RepID=UPI0016623599|nr:ATP-binding protein [Phyllobacterium sp. 628]QND52958.1 HAMP domain-containing protein [Phyllobacterium sp. 628]